MNHHGRTKWKTNSVKQVWEEKRAGGGGGGGWCGGVRGGRSTSIQVKGILMHLLFSLLFPKWFVWQLFFSATLCLPKHFNANCDITKIQKICKRTTSDSFQKGPRNIFSFNHPSWEWSREEKKFLESSSIIFLTCWKCASCFHLPCLYSFPMFALFSWKNDAYH